MLLLAVRAQMHVSYHLESVLDKLVFNCNLLSAHRK